MSPNRLNWVTWAVLGMLAVLLVVTVALLATAVHQHRVSLAAAEARNERVLDRLETILDDERVLRGRQERQAEHDEILAELRALRADLAGD